MIKRIVSFALHQPLFIVLGTVLFIGAGIAAFKALPVEALPDVTDTQVQVITLFPGRAAEEVEKQVTYPIEVSLAGMPNMIRMFSHTQFGLSFVILTFDDKANPYFCTAAGAGTPARGDDSARRAAPTGTAVDGRRRDLPLPGQERQP